MQETIVRLKVISEHHRPETITDALGMSPDASWCIGDFRKHTQIKEVANGWVLDSKLPRSEGLEEHVRALLQSLEKCRDALAQISSTARVEFSCVVYAETPPALNFDKTVIRAIAAMEADLDIDLYIGEEYEDVIVSE